MGKTYLEQHFPSWYLILWSGGNKILRFAPGQSWKVFVPAILLVSPLEQQKNEVLNFLCSSRCTVGHKTPFKHHNKSTKIDTGKLLQSHHACRPPWFLTNKISAYLAKILRTTLILINTLYLNPRDGAEDARTSAKKVRLNGSFVWKGLMGILTWWPGTILL